MSRMLALFESTHAAIKAERICLARHLECRTIAVPRAISSDCGIALEISEELMTTVADVLSKNDINFSWHRLPN
jgi:hypothetical protein